MGNVASFYYGSTEQNTESSSKAESENEHAPKLHMDAENRSQELRQIQDIPSSLTNNSRAKWTKFFQDEIDKNPLYKQYSATKDKDIFFCLPHSMRSSIIREFVRRNKESWSVLLKNIHDRHIPTAGDISIDHWNQFQNSFIRTPTLNNKGREGAIIDFSLMAYEGTLSAKSFAGIMTHTIKTLSSFLEEDFSISLSLEEMIELEEHIASCLVEMIDMHVTACVRSHTATQRLGTIQKQWNTAEAHHDQTPDAKFEPEERTIVLPSEVSNHTMAELQSDLMSCFSAEKPYTRQITEIPAEESIASEAFYTAKNELETKLSVIYGQRNNESLDNSNLY